MTGPTEPFWFLLGLSILILAGTGAVVLVLWALFG